jgi:nucleotide-binding universal stress UspA family protein
MTEIKHILVASDLIDRSCLALGRAIQLKRASAAALTLLHVIKPGLTEELEHNRRAAARATLETHLSQASHEELRRVIIEVLVGDPVSTIVAGAEARGADLIVLGEPAKRRLKELFVGTTAERVVRDSQRPVLVVKTQSDGPEREHRVVVQFHFRYQPFHVGCGARMGFAEILDACCGDIWSDDHSDRAAHAAGRAPQPDQGHQH